jgi:hypothetical protein
MALRLWGVIPCSKDEIEHQFISIKVEHGIRSNPNSAVNQPPDLNKVPKMGRGFPIPHLPPIFGMS